MSFDKSWIDEGIIQSPSIKEAEWYIKGAEAFQKRALGYFMQMAEEMGTDQGDLSINFVLNTLRDLKA